MDHPKTRSISKNLTISLVATIVFISAAFITLNYYQISEREKIWLKNKADEYIDTITSTLEVPLWNIDRESINIICTFYFHNELITTVRLTGMSGETLCEKNENLENQEGYLVNRSRDIFHAGERIGNVRIALAPHRSQELNRQHLVASIISLIISVLGLMVSTGFLLNRFLKKPLDYLGRIVESYAMGDYHPPMQGIRYSEFEPLVSVLVDMGEKIDLQITKLRQAEASLKEHRDQLEQMVVRRTAELEATNRSLQEEIEERKIAVEALRANEQRMTAILRASPVGIGLMINRKLVWANETMYRMVGYDKDSLMGQSSEILYPDCQEYERVGRDLYSNIAESKIGEVDTQWIRKNGTIFDCTIRAYSLDSDDVSKGQIVAVVDTSDAKRLEAELQRAKKMEAIGTLAGGVAHDLNNILSGIVSYPELLLLDLPEDSPLRKPIGTIQKSGERAASIVQDLLTMARRGLSVTETVNLNRIISNK